jgi:hypothetical protein
MKCLICNGKGGEYDSIIYYGAGGGPYYECNYCSGTGKINFFKWLDIKIDQIIHKKYWK